MIDMPPAPEGEALSCLLTGATVPRALLDGLPAGATPCGDGLVRLDIAIEEGRIRALGAAAARLPGHRIPLAGRMVWSCPVDLHTHLDKGHIWPRAANPDGSFAAALETVERDRSTRWSAGDVAARMEFSLRCAYAHGTRAIRTHLDSKPPQDAISWPVFAEMRERWRGRIELQAVSLVLPREYRGAAGERLADRVAEHRGRLGIVLFPMPDLARDLERFVALAEDRGLELDCHVDENLDPASTTLDLLARTVLRRRFSRRVVAGHCCSLSVLEEERRAAILERVRDAGIAIVSLPMCNLYLQDRRPGRTPRLRGIAPVHEIRAAGIPVIFSSDNSRDPFYAYGDLDMMEVFREAVRIGHLDHPFGDWIRTVTTTPAEIMGLSDGGRLAPGGPADLVIFEGRNWSELLARPQSRRVVIRGGRRIESEPPDYAELDGIVAVQSDQGR